MPKPLDHINSLFTIFGVTLAVYSLFWGGFEAGQHHYVDMGSNLIVATLWLLLVLIMVINRVVEAHNDAIRKVDAVFDKVMKEQNDYAKKMVGSRLDQSSEGKNDNADPAPQEVGELLQMAQNIYVEVTGGGREATADEVTTIERTFMERSNGWYCKMILISPEEGRFEIANHPFESFLEDDGEVVPHAHKVVVRDEGMTTTTETTIKPKPRKRPKFIDNDDQAKLDAKNLKRREARRKKKA